MRSKRPRFQKVSHHLSFFSCCPIRQTQFPSVMVFTKLPIRNNIYGVETCIEQEHEAADLEAN